MQEDISIVIRAEHQMEDNAGETGPVVTKTRGKYYLKNDAHYILYEMEDEDSHQKISASIKIKEDVLTISQKGAVKSTLIFKAGERRRSDYVTAFGSFNMETNTRVLAIVNNESEMKIQLDYSLYMNDAHTSDCKMQIELCDVN